MRFNGVVAASRYGLTLSPLQLRIARAGLWTVVGGVASKCLALLASVVVARTLGSAVFGELGMIQITAGMFAVLGSFGLSETGTKYVAQLRLVDPEKAGRLIGLSTLVALLTGATAAFLLAIFSDRVAAGLAAPHLSALLACAGLLLLFGALTAAQTGALSGLEAFREIARINIAVAVISFPAVVGCAYYGGLRGSVAALIVTAALGAFLRFRAVRAEAVRCGIRIDYDVVRSDLPILWRFSLPAVLTGILVTPTYWVCNAIIVNQPGGYAELGVFNAASAWRSAILFLPAILGPLLLPFSSSLMSEGRADESMRLFRIGFALNTGIAAVLALLVIILADSIMSIYGPEFASANRLLVLLAILAVVMSATGSIWNTLMGWGCVWSPFVVSLVWSAAMIAGTWLLRDLGSEGLAWSSLAAHLLQLAGYLVCACLLVRRLAGAPMSKTRRSLERPALYSER